VLALAGLAFTVSVSHLWLLSLTLGLHFGLTEGAERALVRDFAPAAERGTAFGWFYMIVVSRRSRRVAARRPVDTVERQGGIPCLGGDHDDCHPVLLVARAGVGVQLYELSHRRTQI